MVLASLVVLFTALFAATHSSFIDGAFDAFTSNGQDFDAGFQPLSPRQQRRCTLPPPFVNCPDGLTCCPAAYSNCCGNGRDCCPPTSNCYAAGLCCPKTAQTCGKNYCLTPDQTCCGSSACDRGSVCLKTASGAEVCCRPGQTACDPDGCCPSGTTCGTGGRCLRAVTSIAASTRTAATASTRQPPTRPSLSRPPTPSASESCGPRLAGPDPGDFKEVGGECLPVMDFPCVDGLTDQLCESMCGGIQNERGKGSPGVLGDSEMVLTWRGTRVADPECSGFCTDQRDAEGNRLECDEFPFAVTAEGGPGSHKMCISSLQNSRLQGPLIRQYAAFYDLRSGDRFVVRIISCAGGGGGRRLRPRAGDGDLPAVAEGEDGNSTLSTTFSQWVNSPKSPDGDGAGFVVIPLGNVTAGDYTGRLNLGGFSEFAGLAVVDGDGFEYWAAENASELTNEAVEMLFKVEGEDDLVVAAAATKSVSVDASFIATAKPATETSKGTLCRPSGIYLIAVLLLHFAGLNLLLKFVVIAGR